MPCRSYSAGVVGMVDGFVIPPGGVELAADLIKAAALAIPPSFLVSSSPTQQSTPRVLRHGDGSRAGPG